MIEISATQAKRILAFHEKEIALPQLLATPRALRITQDGKNDEFFGLRPGSVVAFSYHHASAVTILVDDGFELPRWFDHFPHDRNNQIGPFQLQPVARPWDL